MVRSRREEIIGAAARVFQEKGYDRATVRDIAAEAGILSGSLYSHVSSKQELFLEVVRPAIEANHDRIAAIGASDLPPAEKLRAALVSLITSFDEHYPQLFVYIRELYPALEVEEPGWRKRYEGYWEQILAEGIAAGVFRPDLDAKLLTYAMLGMCNWMHRWYDPARKYSAREIAEQFAAFVLEGVIAR